ncbi:MAG: extracellular solute-binding protein [Romboutsia sp.]|uniref:extracellular solute-binding protein n=1 Tax=Romboutsia sp. TaxID=1965302 RepID=UPI003F2C76E2
MKRPQSVIISTTLILTMLITGCQSTGSSSKEDANKSNIQVEESGFPIVKEPITLNVMAPGVGKAEWKDMETIKDYSEKTNINLNVTSPPQADFSTKLNLAFASGDLPDVIFAAGSDLKSSMEIDYGSQGTLVALEDLIDQYAPNLKKILDENPDIRKSITTPDGHIYSLPYLTREDTGIWPIGPLWYNGDWLKALNVTELPKTIDEFYELLVRFRDEDPNGNGKKDEIPLSDVKLTWTKQWLMSPFGIKTLDIEENDGKVRYTPATEEYKAYLQFMNKLYKEKLLDQEVYSQSEDQKKAKGQNNQVGVFQEYYSFFMSGKTEEEALDYPMWQPLTSEYSKEPVVPISPRITRGSFAITSKCLTPEAAIRWVDYLYSDEGFEYFNQGPEGVLWNYETNDAGEKVKVFKDNIDPAKGEEERGKITPDYSVMTPGYRRTLDPIKADKNDPESKFSEFIKKETEEKITKYGEVPFPLVYLTREEQDKVAASATDLKTYVEQMEAKFIAGVEPMENWDKYIKTLESMNLKEYVDTYQAAYDRWAKSE